MALTPEDKFEISEVLAKFCCYSDFADYEALKGVYADNPTTVIDGVGTFSGLEWQIEHAKQTEQQTFGQNRHCMTNLWIEPDGDGAIARYFLLNILAGSSPLEAKLMTTGRFEDRMVRTKDGWRIAHRHYMTDQSFQLPEQDAEPAKE